MTAAERRLGYLELGIVSKAHHSSNEFHRIAHVLMSHGGHRLTHSVSGDWSVSSNRVACALKLPPLSFCYACTQQYSRQGRYERDLSPVCGVLSSLWGPSKRFAEIQKLRRELQ